MTTITLDIAVLSRNLRFDSDATSTNHILTLTSDRRVFYTSAYYFCPVVSIRTISCDREPELILYSPPLSIAFNSSNATYQVSLENRNCEFPMRGIKRYPLNDSSKFTILFFQESAIFRKITCKIISVQY